MIQQTVLPFKLETTNDLITSQGGLCLFGEYTLGTGILQRIDSHLPGPGSSVGYKPSEYIFPLLLMLHGGGRSLEDIRGISRDSGLLEILKISKVPSSDAIGDWLRRMGVNGGLESLVAAERYLLLEGINREDVKDYTLDIDATGIEAAKESAKKTYKGYRGYMPIVGHLAENSLIIGDEFREGNEPPANRNFEFIKHCMAQLPEDKRIKYLRSDSAGYQAKIINFCEEEGIEYAIGGDLDSSVKAAIGNLPESSWKMYKEDKSIAEVVHSMNKTKKSFRLIIIRRTYQQDMFEEVNVSVKYTAIATNRNESAEFVVTWYNKRGDHSENRIKDLKIGFGMERMPCGQFEANAVFFRIGILAYNLFRLFLKYTLENSWHRHQIQTIRWRLYQIAGKIVFHSNQIFLKVRRCFCNMFNEIRLKTWEFAQQI